MCSRTPLEDLSKHYPVGLALRPCSPTDKHFSASPALSTFRQLSSHPLSDTLATAPAPTPGPPTLPQEEWAAFRAPRSQMEALPPLSAFPSLCRSSTFAPAYRPPSPCQWEVEAPSHDASSSAYWNPEQETLHSLRTTTPSLWPAPNTFSPISTRPKRPIYDFPTPDEAASVASAASTLRDGRLGAGEEEGSATAMYKPGEKAGRRKAHVLTMLPAVDAGWDFERLFGKPRRWDVARASQGGMLGAEDSSVRDEDLARAVWRDAHRGPKDQQEEGRAELASTEGLQVRAMDQRRDEGQRETFDTMRRVALERLKLLGAHLAWSSSGLGGGVGK